MTPNRAADGAHRPSAAQTTPKNAMPTLFQRLSSLLRPAASKEEPKKVSQEEDRSAPADKIIPPPKGRPAARLRQ